MTKRLQAAAKDIAGKGRYGDDRLLHVSQTEIDGLASLIPGGKLPINPDTGLPEAFFFLPFLAGLGAMAAPAAAAAVPAAAGALGTGLAAGAAGAGLTAATALPAVATGAMGAAGAAGAGLGALAPTAATAAGTGLAAAAPTAISAAAPLAGEAAALAAPTAASALPATAELAAPLTAGTSTLAGAPAGALSSVPSLTPEVGFIGGPAAPLNPMVATAEALPGDLAAGIGPSPLAGGAIPEAAAMPATTSAIPTSTASVFPAAPGEGGIMAGMESVGAVPEAAGAATETGGGFLGGLKSGIGGILGNMDAQKMMQLAGVASMLKGGGGGKKKKGEKKDISGVKYDGGEPNRPSDDYRPGIDPEFRYFNNFQSGGLVNGYAEGGMLTQFKPMAASSGIASLPAYAVPNAQLPTAPAPAASMMPAAPSHMAQFGVEAPGAAAAAPKPKTFAEIMAQNLLDRRNSRASGGLIKGYAEGGIASLMPPEQVPMAPEGDTPKPQSGEDDAALIEATVKAVQGQVPEPQAGTIIQTFVDTFGEQALQDLMAKVQGMGQQEQAAPASMQMPTMGDGMSDSVPAAISGPGGQEPAALSEGEFVVPADVVSGLGNGSTDAGAQQLHGMMDKVRTMRGGGAVQPPAIDPRMAMPI